jgi:hypothetical protein
VRRPVWGDRIWNFVFIGDTRLLKYPLQVVILAVSTALFIRPYLFLSVLICG